MPVLTPLAEALNSTIASDPGLKYFQAGLNTQFAIKAVGSGEDVITVAARSNEIKATSGVSTGTQFTLVAKPEQWLEFLQDIPKMPFQSFHGCEPIPKSSLTHAGSTE
jgi:hypothetical protein